MGSVRASFRELLEPKPDQARGIRGCARVARCRGDGGCGLGLTVAQVDERRDRIREWLGRALLLDCAGEADHRRVYPGIGRRLVLELGDDALCHLWADPGGARHHGLVAHGDGGSEIGRSKGSQHRERDLGADALHRLQQAEPFALDLRQETKQPDLIFANMRLDGERRGLPRRGQFLQRACRAMHAIAHAVHVEDDAILAVGIDDPLELADHRPLAPGSSPLRIAPLRCFATLSAIASPSAASSDGASAFGSSTPIIMRTCPFSPWPVPTMVFFTRLGAYSATGRPAMAGTSMAIPRAWPSLRVAAASLLTKVFSTAASCGACALTISLKP